MVARNTGPLGWHVPIVDSKGHPTPEFMQKWIAQQRANAVIPSLDTPAEVSAVLDVIEADPLSLLVRGPSEWEGFDPGAGRIPYRGALAWTGILTPGDAAKFLAGSSPPAFADVHDADLSLSDILTNNVSTTKHGFAPKLPNDVTKFLNGIGGYTAPLINNLLPSQTAHVGEYLKTDGTNVSWAAAGGGGGVPVVRATSTGTPGTVSGTVTVTLPTGSVAGDTCVIMISGWPNVASVPAGWSPVLAMDIASWGGRMLAKVLSAGDIATGSVGVANGGSKDTVWVAISFVGACSIHVTQLPRGNASTFTIGAGGLDLMPTIPPTTTAQLGFCYMSSSSTFTAPTTVLANAGSKGQLVQNQTVFEKMATVSAGGTSSQSHSFSWVARAP